MNKRHDAIFDDVLSGMDDDKPKREDRAGGARFLKRSNALAEAGEREEKVLRWVDPEDCVMWDRHNRDYAALTAENCRDLIDGIRAQGRQEFPAIVRQKDGQLEVVCGARRHFAVSWLRANNYPQFRYLVEVRDLTDEEAFRLADIENRDREDLTDYERAVDYAAALDHYYEGSQKRMAERLEVSTTWLSRFLQLAALPDEIIEAFASTADIKELHARTIRPLLKRDESKLLLEAQEIGWIQKQAREGQRDPVPVADVMARLKSSVAKPRPKATNKFKFRSGNGEVLATVRGKEVTLKFATNINSTELDTCIRDFKGWRQRFL